MEMIARNIMLVAILCHGAFFLFSQTPNDPATETDLYDILRLKDSLLFNAVFNLCDTTTAKTLVSDDLEFYHDQGGITESKSGFIQSIKDLCSLSYKPSRVLSESSLQVYPLYDNGVLYGAIQSGDHEFYAKEGDKESYLTSTAKFTHLWIIENGEWKLKRVLSYAHHAPRE